MKNDGRNNYSENLVERNIRKSNKKRKRLNEILFSQISCKETTNIGGVLLSTIQ